MSEQLCPKRLLLSRTHPPSRLRNEVLAESIDEEHIADKIKVPIPGSDVIIPETQLENPANSFEVDQQPHDCGSDVRLSPKSQELLNRACISKSRNATVPLPECKMLTKPIERRKTISPPFVFDAAWKAPPKLSQKPQNAIVSSSHASTAHATTPDPNPKVLAEVSSEEKRSEPALSFQNKRHQTQEQPATNHPTPEHDSNTLDVASHVSDEGASSINFGFEFLQIPATDSIEAPHPHRQEFFSGTKDSLRIKGKKSRRLKLSQQLSTWPPKVKYGDEADIPVEGQVHRKPLLNVLPSSPKEHTHHWQFDHLQIGEEAVLPRKQPEVPAVPPHATQKISVLSINDIENGAQSHRVVMQGSNSSSPGCRETRRISAKTVHHSRGGTNGVEKSRKKLRAARPPYLPTLNPAAYTTFGLSPEHEQILTLIASGLAAAQHKARDIADSNTKANEITISSLQSTISYQDNLIEKLRTENNKFREDIQLLHKKGVRVEKYVNGMKHDYTILKGTAQKHYEKCNRNLLEKISQVESEKATLFEEVQTTMIAMDKSRKNMREVMDECYLGLVLSKSMNINLTKQLDKQNGLYEEEKKRRSELEQQINPLLRSVREYLKKSYSEFSEKLGELQRSLDDTSASEERDVRLKLCIDTLQSLQATPLLSSKDLKKAEGMLRFINESINTKLDELTSSVQGIRLPMDGVQRCIGDQLQILRDDLLKYSEATSEYRKVQDTNELLTQELNSRKVMYTALEDQVQTHRQSEASGKSQRTQQEHELDALRCRTPNHGLDSLKLEQEIASLRGQLNESQNELKTKVAELNSMNQCLQDQTDGLKYLIEELHKANITAQSWEMVKMQKRKIPVNATENHGIECRYIKALKENSSALGAGIRPLRDERDAKEGAVLDLQEKLQECEDKLQFSQDEIWSLTSKIENFRNVAAAEVEVEERLSKATQAVSETQSTSSELEHPRQQLAEKKNTLHLKEQDFATLQENPFGLVIESANYQEERIQLRNHLFQNQATIEMLRNQLEARSETHEKNAATVEDNSKESNELQRYLTQAENATMDANAKARCIEDERCQVLEAHKMETSKKMDLFAQEPENGRGWTSMYALCGPPSQFKYPRRPSRARDLALISTPKNHTWKPRNTVNRQNNSVLVANRPSHTEIPILGQSNTSQDRCEYEAERVDPLDDIDVVPMGEARFPIPPNENAVSVVTTALEELPETQKTLVLTFNQFSMGLNQASKSSQNSTSSQLSEAPSDLLDMFEMENGDTPVQESNLQKRHSLGEIPLNSQKTGATNHVSDYLAQNILITCSQDRPKPQVSTTSCREHWETSPKLVPSTEQDNCGDLSAARVGSTPTEIFQRGGRVSSAASSLDFVYRASPTQKTHSHHSKYPDLPYILERSYTPQIPAEASQLKRKSSERHGDDSVSEKRHCSS